MTKALAQNLSATVAQALKSYPEVAALHYESLAANERIGQARSGYFPTLNLRGGDGYEYADNPATRGRTGGDDELERTELSLTLRQNLFQGLGTRSSVESAQAGVLGAKWKERGVSEEIALKVTKAYLDVLQEERQIQLAKENLKAHQGILTLVQKRIKQNLSSRSEESQVLAKIKNVDAVITRSEGALLDTQNNFVTLVGEQPESLNTPPLPTALSDDLESAILIAQKNNADVIKAQALVAQAKAEIQQRKSAFYPSVDLELTGNLDRNLSGTPGRSESFSTMLVMNMNLFAGGSDFYRVREAEFLLKRNQSNLERILRDVAEAVKEAHNAWMVAQSQHKTFASQVITNQKVRKAYQQQYLLGKRTLLDLLDAENDLFISRSNESREQNRTLFAAYRLLTAQGKLLESFGIASPSSLP
ncbi:MAG: TolC family outer membrane protein [Magnetococcales bacterium]|nr:TolC family outer membrane protein [Magnetococcales bacterium]